MKRYDPDGKKISILPSHKEVSHVGSYMCLTVIFWTLVGIACCPFAFGIG